MTTRLPLVRSPTAKLLGPIVQPSRSVSIISVNVPSGSRSPTLIAIDPPLSVVWDWRGAPVLQRAEKDSTAADAPRPRGPGVARRLGEKRGAQRAGSGGVVTSKRAPSACGGVTLP